MTEMHSNERVRSVIEAPLVAAGFDVVDVERQGPVLRVSVDRPGGIDLDGVTEATRLVNDILDRGDLMSNRTTLEVSSPGIERPLRTPEHFRRFVGTEVAVKAKPGTEGERRISGMLEAADDEGVVVAGRRLAYADIERARTVFVWPTSGRTAGQPSSGRTAGQPSSGRVAGQPSSGRTAGQPTSGRTAGQPTRSKKKKKMGRAS